MSSASPIASVVHDFVRTMPMFLGEPQRALASRLEQALASFPFEDHDAKSVAQRLRASGLFDLVVPPVATEATSMDDTLALGADRVSVLSLVLAREGLGYVSPLADSIFAVQGLGSHPIALTPLFRERRELLTAARTGEKIFGFALTEPEAGSDVASMKSVAVKAEGGYRIDGEKIFISNVGIADHYVVFANADPSLGKKGISAFLVDADAEGLTLETIPTSVDHPLGRLVMRGARARARIGEVGAGMRLALGTLDVFRTSVGAAACGMARRALDEAVARVRGRVQFGKPLVEQQLTQAALAEMATELDAARLLVYRAAFLKDKGERASSEVAMAKMFATEGAQRIIDRAVQLFGGLGVVEGTVVERLYREIRPLRIYEGTTEIQKLIIGGALGSPRGGA